MASKKKTKPLTIEQLIAEGLAVLQDEIMKLKNNQVDRLLDPKAASILTDYLRTLIIIKREDRQTAMADELEKLDDENLKVLAEQAAQYLKNN